MFTPTNKQNTIIMKATAQRYTITDQFGDKVIFAIENNYRGETFTKYDCRLEVSHGKYTTEYKNEDSFYKALRRAEKTLNAKSKYTEYGF
jgi:hypothetical protein